MSTLAQYLSQSSSALPDDWYSAALGGLIIGSSSVSYLIMYGRVCGISGILGRVMDHSLSFINNTKQSALLIQFGFILGLFLSTFISPITVNTTTNSIVMLLSGILVGFGTRFGNGCTSGHGVCGLARRSSRSFTAVIVFLSMGIISATLSAIFLPKLYTKNMESSMGIDSVFGKYVSYALIMVMICFMIQQNVHKMQLFETVSSMGVGLLFGSGLILSGMIYPSKVRDFLNVAPNGFMEHWDPSLMFVLCCALIMSVSLYPLVLWCLRKPILDPEFHLPTNTVIDERLIIGSSIFGIGWGLGGVCPGPGIIVIIATSNIYDPIWIWFFGLIIGMQMFHPFLKYIYHRKSL